MICSLFTGQTSKEGIFMKYSYEFKKECVQLYRENNINWTPDEKLEIVSKVLAGNSIKSIAIEYAINDG